MFYNSSRKTLKELTMNTFLKKIFFLIGITLCLPIKAALPIFSTTDNPEWYQIYLLTGDVVLQDMGDGEKILTKKQSEEAEQLWQLIGNEESFLLVNKSGRYVNYNGERFITTSQKTQATELYLISQERNFEIAVKSKASETYKAMNPFNGTGVDRDLGLWVSGDVNNTLTFMKPKKIINPFPVVGINGYSPKNKNTLWYDAPTTLAKVDNPWMEYALPIGNGQLGAMIYGGIACEQVQFNEKTIWTGNSTNGGRGAYQNFGNIYIEDLSDIFGYTEDKAVQEYYRQLDLSNATATVSYKSPDKSITFTREYISSYPDNVNAIHLKASKEKQISIKVSMDDAVGKTTPVYDKDNATIYGKLTTITYVANMKVIPVGGELSTDEDGIVVKNANEVFILMSGGSDYDPIASGYISGTQLLENKIKDCVNQAANKGWENLYANHVADYKSFYDRLSLDFPDAENKVTTENLIKQYNTPGASSAITHMLEQLYFHYGRYLMIASSRGIDLPSNLQGIWNNSPAPPWESDIHSNINVQMNYWPAEPTNLSELHLPYLHYIYNMAEVQPQWKEYAKQSGHTVGWTCFTQNNIFGQSNWGENYVVANAWYANHPWLHYRYTLDKEFLRTKGFPVMLSATKFWMERLIKDRKVQDGTWVCPNEYSPEQNGPEIDQQDGVAHAQQLVWDLFHNTLQAIEVLGYKDAKVDEAFVSELKEKFEHLDNGLHTETYTGKWGATHNGVSTGDVLLREWKYSTYDKGENEHRHLAHLMCLYPLGQVSMHSPEFEAVINSLKLRGDASTGWSLGWKINLWARAMDGDHAYKILKNALKHSTSYGVDQYAGGIYYNLFDSHAPFQIDGNFGTCSGIAEMLLQSHTDTLYLLPALPSKWASGTAKGFKAVGNFTVDQIWEEGKLKEAKVISGAGLPCSIQYNGISKATVTDNQGNVIDTKTINEDVISFDTQKEGVYTIHFDISSDIDSPDSDKEDNTKLVFKDRYTIYTKNKDVCLTAYDLSGKTLGRTHGGKISLPKMRGKIILVEAKNDNGQYSKNKILLSK